LWTLAEQEWSDSLSKFPVRIISAAVNNLKKNPSPYPPNLPEFIDLCEIEMKAERRKNRHPCEEVGKYVPMSQLTAEIFIENIEKCIKNDRPDLRAKLEQWFLLISEKGVWLAEP
jgi:hypothetical protein